MSELTEEQKIKEEDGWHTTKPEFTEDCILVAATYHSHPKNTHWQYTLYEIKKTDGYNDKDEPCWYWGIFCEDGVEWGDLEDLSANKYLVLKPLPSPPNTVNK
jgi:hypothetical protein